MSDIETPIIGDHHDVENVTAEIHDELLRLADFCESGDFEEATDSFDKVRVQMEGIRLYLTAQTKDN